MKRRGAGLLVVAIAVLLAAAPLDTSAAAPSGHAGAHVLIDSPMWPGATCYYPLTHDDFVHRVRVRAPIVYAYDATSGVDTQWVGWWFHVQQSTDGLSWHELVGAKTHVVKAKASDGYNAQWAPQHLALPADQYNRYRVVLSLRWYGPGGTRIVARATMSPTNYLETGPALSNPLTYCEGSLG
jgi:hypothetical protein